MSNNAGLSFYLNVAAVAKRRLLLRLLLIIGLAIPFAVSAHQIQTTRLSSQNGMDFHLFWVMGDISRGKNWGNVYLWQVRKAVRAFAYHKAAQEHMSPQLQRMFTRSYGFYPTATPFLYTVFDLIKIPDFTSAYWAYQHFAIGCYCYGLFALCMLRRISVLETVAFGFLWPHFYWPYFSDLYFANVNSLQIAGVAIFVALRNLPMPDTKNFLSALFLALFIAFKPNYLFGGAALAILWLARGDGRELAFLAAGGLIGAVIALVLPSYVLGSSCSWTAWVQGMRADTLPFHDSHFFLGIPNTSAASHHWVLMAFILFSLVLAPVVWKEIRYSKIQRDSLRATEGVRQEWILLSIGPAIYVLTVPLYNFHYYTLMAPLFIALIPSAANALAERWQFRMVRRALLIGIFLLLSNNTNAGIAGPPPDRRPIVLGTFLLLLAAVGELTLMRGIGEDFDVAGNGGTEAVKA